MQLKRILADEYSGFSENAVTKLVVDSTLIVDDRGTADDGAEKKLLPWFCMVVVDIKEALINSVFVTPAQAGVQKINELQIPACAHYCLEYFTPSFL